MVPLSATRSCCGYHFLVLAFVVILLAGALTFEALERDIEVQKRFHVSEIKREFAQKFNIGGVLIRIDFLVRNLIN